jgi:hypothetical protein
MMETKKSVVKSITFNREWANPKGGKIYYHNIVFENGDKGEFSTNKDPQNKFIVGSEEEYTILTEEKEKKSGQGTWIKITIDKPKNVGTYGGGYKPRFDANKQRRIARAVGLKAEIKLKQTLDIKSKTFEIANAVSEWIIQNGGQDEAMHISGSAAVNIAYEIVEGIKSESDKAVYTDINEFLKLCKSLFKYMTS